MDRDYYYYYRPPHSYFFNTWDVRKQLIDTSRRLSYEGFSDEISVLDSYLHILGENMGLKKSTVNLLISDDEILPLVADRPLDQHLENLFHEMYLSLEAKPPGNIAVAEFDVLGGREVAERRSKPEEVRLSGSFRWRASARRCSRRGPSCLPCLLCQPALPWAQARTPCSSRWSPA